MSYLTDKLLEYIDEPPKRCGYECCFYIANTYIDSTVFSGNYDRPHCGIDNGKPVAGNSCRLNKHAFTKMLLEHL